MAGEWREAKVDEVCSLIVDCVNKTAPVVEGPTPYKMVRTTNIRNGRIDLSDCKYVEKETFEKWTRRAAVLDGDVLLTREAPIGEVGYVQGTETIFLGQRIMQYRANPEVLHSRFLLYTFLSPKLRQQFGAHEGSGSVVSHIRVGDCFKFQIPLPDLDEQRAVAHILGTLDDKIELNRRMNETLEAIARAIFKSWFVDFDPVRAKASGEPPESICRRLRLTPDLLALFPDRLVDSELGEIPEGWEQKRVDDLMELAYGKALKASDRVNGPVPVYGSGGITGYHSEHLVDGPGIIVGRKGTVGSLYWEDRSFFPIDTVFYVVPKVQLTYCYYLLQTLGLDRMNTDAAVPGLNRSNVYRLPVAWSPIELRQAFDRVAKPLRDRMFTNKQESQTLENIRDTLLPKLLSGELRVPVVDILAEATA